MSFVVTEFRKNWLLIPLFALQQPPPRRPSIQFRARSRASLIVTACNLEIPLKYLLKREFEELTSGVSISEVDEWVCCPRFSRFQASPPAKGVVEAGNVRF